ncbi:MAG: hypothetical protein KAR65_10665 [Anaerolineales bacterium]|nr:hypothetical protein [Anaerolineales bacterium]MCK5635234.1 hypothetical protein [Anaerolineales bacterium]
MTDSSFWNDLVTKTLTIYANVIFVVLWVGFAIALVVNQEWLDVLWTWAQALPLLPKIIVWVLFLPILVGLWIWESAWPVLGRLVGLAGIVGWTLLAVYGWFKTFR